MGGRRGERERQESGDREAEAGQQGQGVSPGEREAEAGDGAARGGDGDKIEKQRPKDTRSPRKTEREDRARAGRKRPR